MVRRAEGVAALIVTAAVFQDVLRPRTLPLEVWERTMQVNLTGTWLANRAFGTRMAARGGGSIVNVASIAAIASMPVHAYGTSKAAVVALDEEPGRRMGRAGVRVNAVSPDRRWCRASKSGSIGPLRGRSREFTALGAWCGRTKSRKRSNSSPPSRASAITGRQPRRRCGLGRGIDLGAVRRRAAGAAKAGD